MKKKELLFIFIFYFFNSHTQVTYNVNVGSNNDPIIANISVTYQGVDTPWMWIDYSKVSSPLYSFFTNSTQAIKVMTGIEYNFDLTNPSTNPSPYGEDYQFRIVLKKTGYAPVSVAQGTFTTDGLPVPLPSVNILSITPTTTGASVKVWANGHGFKYSLKIAHTKTPPMPSPLDSVVVSGGGECVYTFNISSYASCDLVFIKITASSGGGTTNVDSSFYVKAGTPSLTNISASATNNKVIVSGMVSSGGECPQATVKVRLRWGYSASSLSGANNWITGLLGDNVIVDSVVSLPENTTVYYRWEGVTVTGNTFYSQISQVTTSQTISCTIIIPPYPISNLNGPNCSFSFKAKTNDPLGVEARVIYQNSSNFFSYFSSLSITIFGNSYTTYTITLDNLIPGDTNYFKIVWISNSSNIFGESTVYSAFIPKVGIEEIWMNEKKSKDDEIFYDLIGRRISKETLPQYRGLIIGNKKKYFKKE